MKNIELPKSKIYEPYYRITTAKELLLLTLRICNMLEKGEISENKLNKTILVDNTLRIECNWEPHTLPRLAKNLRLCVAGNCFISIDEALDGILGEKPKEYLDTDIDALRAIIYMLRCAIAHNPATPIWKVKDTYRRNFRINEIGYELKIKDLDGRPLKHSHYGGLSGIISLIDYSLKVAKKYTKGSGA
jgi:hypothetical protein